MNKWRNLLRISLFISCSLSAYKYEVENATDFEVPVRIGTTGFFSLCGEFYDDDIPPHSTKTLGNNGLCCISYIRVVGPTIENKLNTAAPHRNVDEINSSGCWGHKFKVTAIEKVVKVREK